MTTSHVDAPGGRLFVVGRSTSDDVEVSLRADLLAVMDALGIGRAALVGNSRGGTTALDTATESQERIVAVVSVAAGLGGFDGDSTPEELAIFEEQGSVFEFLAPFDRWE